MGGRANPAGEGHGGAKEGLRRGGGQGAGPVPPGEAGPPRAGGRQQGQHCGPIRGVRGVLRHMFIVSPRNFHK